MAKKERSASFKKYQSIAYAAGLGSLLGSGIIVGLSSTITVWQRGFNMTNSQVGIISGALTFAIAIGSLLSGKITKKFGLEKAFNWTNCFYAIGTLLCVLSMNYPMLLIGAVIAGLTSGMDLPISLTMVSHDAPDDKTSSELVSFTQLFWQVGIMISYVCSFLVARLSGVTGPRIVFAILTAVALITWGWRTFSPKLKQFHKEGEDHYQAKLANTDSQEKKFNGSVLKSLFSNSTLLKYFFAILIFYVGWNLLANTWGQFQTFMLVKAHASQSLATGYGIATQLLGLPLVAFYSWVSGSKYRGISFHIGSLVMLIAMIAMAIVGSNLWIIMGAIFLYGVGSNFSGEALYKVWTQESFPIEMRSSVQGLINGLSRIACALFAFVTPVLVVPSVIKTTMWCFAGIVLLGWIAGSLMIHWQKKYGLK